MHAEDTEAVEIIKRNPRTGETLYTIAEPTDQEIGECMARARAAAPRIRDMSVAARIQETLKLRAYLVKHKESLVQSVVRENGKCVTDALIGDVFTCVDLIDHYARNAEKILADEKVKTPLMLMGKQSSIMYCPIGPVLVISPWNYPLNTALTPAICAFLAGNPVIIKPSEWTPLKGVLDVILRDCGMLKEAIQVVFGGRSAGQRLIEARPAKIFFTGSVRGGKEVLSQASRHLIPVELELGGKDPMIVFDDANLDRAANGALWGALNNTGQGCTSVERCFVQSTVFETFLGMLRERFAKVRTTDTVGEAQDTGTLDIGCITTPFQREKIAAQVEEARNAGADVWAAYDPNPDSPCYPPTIISGIHREMAVQREETFGPVITVQPFETEEEAVRLANDTEYGLSSSVWTANLDRARRVARQIEAGNVCINDVMVTEGNSGLPFGGVKSSGMGRYKGRPGLHNFCNTKSVMADKGGKTSEAHWYPYSPAKYQLLSGVLECIGSRNLFRLLQLARTGLKLDNYTKKSVIHP